METHLRSQRNVILDRRDFYRRNQATDELFDDYFIALKEISEFCDFCKHCTEERLRDRILTGLCDEATVQKLLSETDLTLKKTVDICRARENAYANASALTGDRLQAVSAYRRGQRSRSSGRDISPHRQRDTSPSRQCRFCGGEWHQRLAMCPARNHRCSACNRLHHFSSVCRNGQDQTTHSGQHGDGSQQQDRQQSPQNTPPRNTRSRRRDASPPPHARAFTRIGRHNPKTRSCAKCFAFAFP